MPYQETYVFQADSTFTKTRQQDTAVVVARGRFAVQNFSDGPYTVLTYAAPSPLIGSCTASSRTETLALQAEDTLVNTWQACDGPKLEYKKVHAHTTQTR